MLAMRYNDTQRNRLTFETKTNAFFIEPFVAFFLLHWIYFRHFFNWMSQIDLNKRYLSCPKYKKQIQLNIPLK